MTADIREEPAVIRSPSLGQVQGFKEESNLPGLRKGVETAVSGRAETVELG